MMNVGRTSFMLSTTLAKSSAKATVHPAKQREVIAGGPLQRVRERQEREEHMGVVDVIAEVVVDLARVGDEIVMRQHDALRVSRSFPRYR